MEKMAFEVDIKSFVSGITRVVFVPKSFQSYCDCRTLGISSTNHQGISTTNHHLCFDCHFPDDPRLLTSRLISSVVE